MIGLHILLEMFIEWKMLLYGSEISLKFITMGTIASQITSLPSVYSTVYSGADQSKHQSSASLDVV